MPVLGSRGKQNQKDLQRRSTLGGPLGFRHGTQYSRSDPNLVNATAALDNSLGLGDGAHTQAAHEGQVRRMSAFVERSRSPSPPIQSATPNTKRFSMLKFRHASDPQLSAKAKQQLTSPPPPVPVMPPAPPIITTAPTMDSMSTTDTKRRTKLNPFARPRQSAGPIVVEPGKPRKSLDKRLRPENHRSVFGSFRGRKSMSDERGRLTANSSRGAPPANGERAASALALPISRKSESSRSDEDESDRPRSSFATAPATPTLRPSKAANHNHSTFSWLPHKKKNRNSLFPLPARIPPSQFPNTAPATPRASTSAVSSGSPDRSPSNYSPPLTAIHHSQYSHLTDESHPPSHAILAASSVSFAAPGGPLLRNDSTTSAGSSRSTTALAPPMLSKLRNRSSTMGSTGGKSDDGPPPTPPFATGSGRTSTSTAGRSSFSNLSSFFGHKFRPGSDPMSPRHGSPAQGGLVTPGGVSNPNSLNISREVISLPEREEGETSGRYLERLESRVDHSLVASVLSTSGDDFMHIVMRSFMRKFAFFGDPLDMAIRKLLMEVDLPKEAQQIDRVLQGFADRYHECNPGIFVTADDAYFIAFSILILQTDAFNKNNKRKMGKQDYIKNSSIEGVSNDVLGCFYENIVYTPFIRVEDDFELRAAKNKNKKVNKAIKNAMPEPVKKAASKEPLDPYELIFQSKLDILRPPIGEVMNMDDPYSYLGTAKALDVRRLMSSAKSGVLQIESSRSRPDAFMSPSTIDNPNEAKAGLVDLPVEKVGILWRKDPKKKTARSPWQEWGAVLTGSGLCFFKNAGWVKNLKHQYDQHIERGHGESPVVFKPTIAVFKPDYMLPTDNGVALQDANYKRHKNAFIFFRTNGIEETFLADNETELNEWLAKLNHQAAFKTAGIRQRGLVGGHYEGQRQRGLRRLESTNATKTVQSPSGDVTIQSGKIDFQLALQISAARREAMALRILEAEDKFSVSIKQLESQLRDSRHLLILAPIQPKTREQIVHAAGRMSAKLKWLRIEIWRMKCHRDILALDLEEEKRIAADLATKVQRMNGSAPNLASASSLSANRAVKEPSLRGGGLDRLNSNTSSGVISPLTVPQSPLSSQRPGYETDISDVETFGTPPESTPQHSPYRATDPRSSLWEPLSIKPPPAQASQRESFVTANSRSPVSEGPQRKQSGSTLNADQLDSPSGTSEYATPLVDDNEAQARREASGGLAGPVSLDGRTDTGDDSDSSYHHINTIASSPDSRSRVRRSLHRTLREPREVSAGHHRQGSKKSKGDSISSAITDEAADEVTHPEVLARKKGSFTVHGKKASVVTFGSEWQNMSGEERLKVRKQMQTGDSTLSVPSVTDDEPPRLLNGRRASNTSSVSAATNTSHSLRHQGSGAFSNDGSVKIPSNAASASQTSLRDRRIARQRSSSSQTVLGPGSVSGSISNPSALKDAKIQEDKEKERSRSPAPAEDESEAARAGEVERSPTQTVEA